MKNIILFYCIIISTTYLKLSKLHYPPILIGSINMSIKSLNKKNEILQLKLFKYVLKVSTLYWSWVNCIGTRIFSKNKRRYLFKKLINKCLSETSLIIYINLKLNIYII